MSGVFPSNLVEGFLRMAWCSVGVAVGVGAALFLIHPTIPPFILASFGGSAIFLFGLTRAEAAQPRALIGGHVGGALIGAACYQLLGDAPWVYVTAEVIALWFMLLTRTVHPPAGANPIIMVHTHSTWVAVFDPVIAGVAALLLIAMAWSRLFPKLVHYPVRWDAPSPPEVFWGGWRRE